MFLWDAHAWLPKEWLSVLHQIPIMWLMHDGMLKNFFLEVFFFTQKHDFLNMSLKAVRNCVFFDLQIIIIEAAPLFR